MTNSRSPQSRSRDHRPAKGQSPSLPRWLCSRDRRHNDDADLITSKVVIGPIPLAETIASEGILAQLQAELGTESGTVAMEVYSGDSAEQVAADAIAGTSPKFTRTITAGRSNTIRPRIRGVYACIVLTSTAEWSSEVMLSTLATTGRRRQ